MSDARDPLSSSTVPPRMPSPPSRRSGGSTFLGVILGMSLSINFLILAGICVCFFLSYKLAGGLGDVGERSRALERHHSGDAAASDKIAIIHLDGVLMEGLIGYAHRQIEQAAKDKSVKAVVLRINSPGGTITASDDIHHRLIELRDGKDDRAGKPLVVSMGSVAASGGYYIAMPAKVLYAEKTTITGSIGVYASFPNVKELSDNVGFHMNLIKAGRVKDSGSPFQEMKPDERYLWQQMVNHAYDDFKGVVEQGRPALKDKLEEKVIDEKVKVKERVPVFDNGKTEDKVVERTIDYVRQRADGGIWTADKALEFGLIDKIGYLDAAIKEAAGLAGLGEKYNTVSYERPITLSDMLFGIKAPDPALRLDVAQLGAAATPRLWYMAPQSELAGILSSMGQ